MDRQGDSCPGCTLDKADGGSEVLGPENMWHLELNMHMSSRPPTVPKPASCYPLPRPGSGGRPGCHTSDLDAVPGRLPPLPWWVSMQTGGSRVPAGEFQEKGGLEVGGGRRGRQSLAEVGQGHTASRVALL